MRSEHQTWRRTNGGSCVDPSQRIRFTFDGRELEGLSGDTLASALLANGVHIVGRSFKYHRPRGLLAAGAEEPNALVRIGLPPHEQPIMRATEVELYDGLVARPVNAWPNVRWDLQGLLDRLHRFLPAGFYYKTFKWPGWNMHSRIIRRLAGIGHVPEEADASRYAVRHGWCDVLVVGAGPAGLKAAREAAADGARVILLEQGPVPGGSALWREGLIEGISPRAWLDECLADLSQRPDVRILPRTMAFGIYDANMVAAAERLTDHRPADGKDVARQRLWKLRTDKLILATGALERPLVFPENDRPGIMLASAVQEYLGRYGVKAGRDIAVVTNNDGAYAAAFALHAAGARVTILDLRPAAGEVARKARERGIRVHAGATIAAAIGTPVQALRFVTADGERHSLSCDLVAMSAGWSPTLHLFSQAGGSLRFDEALGAFVPDRYPERIEVTGAAAGELPGAHGAPTDPAFSSGANWPRQRDRQWVDFHNDVTVADVELAAREGFVSVEHLKRYTTTGMAVDQGKTSNVNALLQLGIAIGRAPAAVGTTRFRPPYCPVPFGLLAGDVRGARLHPLRRLALHEEHAALGAQFTEMSGWLRPEYYPQDGETLAAAVQREVLAVRTSVGLFDSSPLGKIEISGRDAGELLGRFYGTLPAALAIGEVAPTLTLDDEGRIIDDSHVARLAEHRFLLVTTTAAAPVVTALLERFLQLEWPHLEAFVTNVTTQWAMLSLAGPSSAELIRQCGLEGPEGPLDRLRVGDIQLDGLRLRILTISFNGERAFEIMVPAAGAGRIWKLLCETSGEAGPTPFGLEALDVLRIEMGYIHVGVETDGDTTPADIGRCSATHRTEAIGARSLRRSQALRSPRLQLVGLRAIGTEKLPVGAEVSDGWDGPAYGYVTSSVMSPTLGRPVALAMVERGRSRIDQTVGLQHADRRFQAVVTGPDFITVEGSRQ